MLWNLFAFVEVMGLFFGNQKKKPTSFPYSISSILAVTIGAAGFIDDCLYV